jgi:hypothetical protein
LFQQEKQFKVHFNRKKSSFERESFFLQQKEFNLSVDSLSLQGKEFILAGKKVNFSRKEFISAGDSPVKRVHQHKIVYF